MEFRKFAVAGVSYGQGLTEIRRSVLRKEGKPVPQEAEVGPGNKRTPNVNVLDPGLDILLEVKGHDVRYLRVREFFLHLAVNHAVMPEFGPGDELGYFASSPD